jgi:N-acetylneuraminic acid mutarotase
VSSSPQERAALRHEARAGQIRRRRAGAAGVLLAFIIVIVVAVSGGSSSHHAGKTATKPTASSPAAVHVLVTQTGQLPTAIQDAAAAPAGGSGTLLMGGLEAGETSVSGVLKLEGAAAGSVGSLPTALHDACASAVSGAVYLFGGGQSESFSQILKVPASGTPQTAGELPTRASDVACTTVSEVVYIVGGYTGQEPLNTIVAWRPSTGPKVVATLPKPLRYAAVGNVGGKVLIAGGTSGASASRDIYSFDPASATVTHLGLLPRPVTHAAGAAAGGALLVIGGRDAAERSQTADVLAVSPTGTVAIAGSLPHPLSDLAAVASGEAILLAGGQDNAGQPQSSILTLTLKH